MPGSRRAHRVTAGVVVALVASACAQGVGIRPPADFTTPTVDVEVIRTTSEQPARTTTTTTQPVRAACSEPIRAVAAAASSRQVARLGTDPVEVAISVSETTFACADDLVVVPADDLDRIAIGGRLAVALGAPVLFARSTTAEALDGEIGRLAPARAFLIGEGLQVALPRYTQLRQFGGSTAAIAAEVNDLLGTTESVTLPTGGGTATVVAAVDAMVGGQGLAAPSSAGSGGSTAGGTSEDVTTTTVGDVAEDTVEDAVPVAYVGSGATGEVWLTASAHPELAFPAIAAAAASGGLATLVDGRDLRTLPEIGRIIQSSSGGASTVHLLGEMTEDAEWQVATLAEADEIPGGGFLMLPRRLVALYGHPGAAVLGVLGEQSAAESVVRAQQVAQGYGADGTPVLPTFEIITTIASSAAGADGDYSDESTLDHLRPWIDIARENGIYVILDLQSGRTDFLTQAKRYEEFLLEPHVGLALDPEWRLKPDERHMRQIGQVEAAEVNTVVDWLAELVRDNALPQKMLVLHQFRMSMLQDRDEIRTPAELVTVVHMDGHGALNVKYGTWGVITEGWQDYGWHYGWKNFYDEDLPTPTPDIVLDLVPTAVFVSYQ